MLPHRVFPANPLIYRSSDAHCLARNPILSPFFASLFETGFSFLLSIAASFEVNCAFGLAAAVDLCNWIKREDRQGPKRGSKCTTNPDAERPGLIEKCHRLILTRMRTQQHNANKSKRRRHYNAQKKKKRRNLRGPIFSMFDLLSAWMDTKT
jgi:hypothetical protein